MIEICGGPLFVGPLGSCPLCPLLNPALYILIIMRDIICYHKFGQKYCQNFMYKI